MYLMLAYIVVALVGNAAIYFIGLAVERVWPAGSLLIFLCLFFVVLWLSWIIAVKVTEPKAEAAAP